MLSCTGGFAGALQYGTVDELGCSQGYIFKVLKANELRLKDVFK